MHRATPLNTAFRAYTAGGTRTVIDEADDKKLMQESKGNFMKGETRGEIESPQNYGFTSHVMPADKDNKGKIKMGAEGFVSFMGGNRSFPVIQVMDDRRHRLKEIAKGDTAMYGAREWGEQFHIDKEGMWMSGNTQRKIKLQLVENSNDQQTGQQDGQQGGQSQQGQQNQQSSLGAKGQTPLNGQNSSDFIEITANKITIRRGGGYVVITDDDIIGYVDGDDKKSFRATKDHTHIRHKDHVIWVDEKGCWSTVPIKQRPHEDPGVP